MCNRHCVAASCKLLVGGVALYDDGYGDLRVFHGGKAYKPREVQLALLGQYLGGARFPRDGQTLPPCGGRNRSAHE